MAAVQMERAQAATAAQLQAEAERSAAAANAAEAERRRKAEEEQSAAAAKAAQEERAKAAQLQAEAERSAAAANAAEAERNSVADAFRMQAPLHIVITTFHLKDDPVLVQEFLNFLSLGLDVTRDFKGCRHVEASVTEDKKGVILYQKWVSRALYDTYTQFRQQEGALKPVMEKCCVAPFITVVHALHSSI